MVKTLVEVKIFLVIFVAAWSSEANLLKRNNAYTLYGYVEVL